MAATVTLLSEAGEGTKATVCLPVEQDAARRRRNPHAAPDEQQLQFRACRPGRTRPAGAAPFPHFEAGRYRRPVRAARRRQDDLWRGCCWRGLASPMRCRARPLLSCRVTLRHGPPCCIAISTGWSKATLPSLGSRISFPPASPCRMAGARQWLAAERPACHRHGGTAEPNRRRLVLSGHGTWSARLDRLRALSDFLAGTPYAEAASAYLQGDASTRCLCPHALGRSLRRLDGFAETT